MTVREIYDAIDRIAPFQTAMDFDNVGILVGDENVNVTKTLLCLDVTPRVLREAKSIGVELIISHHPVIFNPLRTVQPQNIIYALVQSGIAVISAHTNLDMAYPYGVNDALCRKLGLQNVRGILKEGETDIAYMGELSEEMTTEDFAAHIKEALGLSAVRCTAVSKMLRTVAVVGGAGGDYALAAQAKGADAFVTGEVKHHEAIAAQQNAQKYYKNYRKAKTAEEKLTEQIGLAQTELTYIDSVFESLALAENERDLNEIRAELAEQGYVRRKAGKKNQKQPALSAPLKFKTSDGFTVLVGRNNRQNDKLTTKDANNNDIWFHTKNIPGSHTVLVTDGKAPTETAMEEAAVLAAQHSRAKDSAQVPVDYTQIRYVSKPQGAKPGMVIYVQYKTVYVDPTTESKAKQQS